MLKYLSFLMLPILLFFAEEALAEIKSNLKYSFTNLLGTTDGVAGNLAFYINLATDPGVANRLFDLYESITPQDILEMAKKYFMKTNSTVVILTGGNAK